MASIRLKAGSARRAGKAHGAAKRRRERVCAHRSRSSRPDWRSRRSRRQALLDQFSRSVRHAPIMGKDIALLSALRRKRLCVWSAGGRPNLLLVEILLVLVTAEQAHAEPASTELPTPQRAREVRQLDI